MEQSTHEIRVKEWSKIIQDCYTSGLTKKEWCVQNHINEKSFYYWQRVIRKETLAKYPLPQSDVQTTFVELPSPKFSVSVQETECWGVFMAKELGRSPSDHPGTVPASDGGL